MKGHCLGKYLFFYGNAQHSTTFTGNHIPNLKVVHYPQAHTVSTFLPDMDFIVEQCASAQRQLQTLQ